MRINKEKSNVVHFRPTRSKITENEFKYGDQLLEIVPGYKYLGIYFDEHLTFTQAIDILSNSAG